MEVTLVWRIKTTPKLKRGKERFEKGFFVSNHMKAKEEGEEGSFISHK